MYVGDLKRAVEDVLLRPEDKRPSRGGTIAALDLCQPDPATSSSSPSSSSAGPAPSAAARTSCSSSDPISEDPSTSRQNNHLCASTSLDTIVSRPQPLFHRHSAGVSRRQSRVFANLHSKRKRSNSLTNYNNKRPGVSVSLPPSARQTPMRFGEDHAYRSSLGSSESHSSVARSEDYSQDCVAEEDETITSQTWVFPTGDASPPQQLTPPLFHSLPNQQSTPPLFHSLPNQQSTPPTQHDPFLSFRSVNQQDDLMDCD